MAVYLVGHEQANKLIQTKKNEIKEESFKLYNHNLLSLF